MSLPDPGLPGHEPPGTARLRRQLGRQRVLLGLMIILLIVVAVWSVVGVSMLSGQVASLESKIDGLESRTVTSAAAGQPSAPQAAPSPAGGSSERASAPEVDADVESPVGSVTGGAILVGDPEAKKVVEVYVDYQCPYCQRWETEIGTALMERALQPGSGIAVRQYNMAFLGEANRSLDPPGASARAAAAAACVLDGDGAQAFVEFNAAVFAAPGGQDAATRFDTASLVALAGGLGAGSGTVECIEQGRYIPFVSATTQAAFARGVTGTPTVLVNGKVLEDTFGDPQLLSLLQM